MPKKTKPKGGGLTAADWNAPETPNIQVDSAHDNSDTTAVHTSQVSSEGTEHQKIGPGATTNSFLDVNQTVDLIALLHCMLDYVKAHPCPTVNHLVQCSIVLADGSFLAGALEERARGFFGDATWNAAVEQYRDTTSKREVHVIPLNSTEGSDTNRH